MKTYIALFLALFVSASVMAQNPSYNPYVDVFKPSTNYAGTLMSLRSVTTAYDDTTKAIFTRGFGAVYVSLQSSANDSIRVLVSYAASEDGVVYGSFIAVDSLISISGVGTVKFIPLPAAALGAYSVKVRVRGNSDVVTYSDSPTTKLTTKIVKVPFTIYKAK